MPLSGPLGSKLTASKPAENELSELIDSQETASWGIRSVNADTNSTQTTQSETENPDIANVSLGQRFIEKLPHKLFTIYQALRLKSHGYGFQTVYHLMLDIQTKHGSSKEAHREFNESVQFYLKLNEVCRSVHKKFPEKNINTVQIKNFIEMLQEFFGFSEEQAFKHFEEVLLKTRRINPTKDQAHSKIIEMLQEFFGFSEEQASMYFGEALLKTRRITPTKDQAHSETEEVLFGPIINSGVDLQMYALDSKRWHLPRQQKFIDAVNLLGLNKNNTLTKEIVDQAFQESALKYHSEGTTDSEASKELQAAHELLTDDRTELSIVSKIIN